MHNIAEQRCGYTIAFDEEMRVHVEGQQPNMATSLLEELRALKNAIYR